MNFYLYLDNTTELLQPIKTIVLSILAILALISILIYQIILTFLEFQLINKYHLKNTVVSFKMMLELHIVPVVFHGPEYYRV